MRGGELIAGRENGGRGIELFKVVSWRANRRGGCGDRPTRKTRPPAGHWRNRCFPPAPRCRLKAGSCTGSGLKRMSVYRVRSGNLRQKVARGFLIGEHRVIILLGLVIRWRRPSWPEGCSSTDKPAQAPPCRESESPRRNCSTARSAGWFGRNDERSNERVFPGPSDHAADWRWLSCCQCHGCRATRRRRQSNPGCSSCRPIPGRD